MSTVQQQLLDFRDCIEMIREARPRVTVVGDFMLDGWWAGLVRRNAREAPAPVIEVSDRVDAPGGAANTALNLASLGARVCAVGAIGVDGAASRLRRHLERAGVDCGLLREVPGTRTTTKVRVSVEGEMLLRIDDEQSEVWPPDARGRLVGDAAIGLADSDALLVCDYGSALISAEVVSALACLPRAPLVVVDAHDPCRWRELRPDVITPNSAETERAQSRPLGEGAGRVHRLEAAELLERTGAATVVVTLDRVGTVMLRADQPAHRTQALPGPEQHASGAGDVFVAALTVGRASGLTLERAADFAQCAADTAVKKPGTCVCSLDELLESAAPFSTRARTGPARRGSRRPALDTRTG